MGYTLIILVVNKQNFANYEPFGLALSLEVHVRQIFSRRFFDWLKAACGGPTPWLTGVCVLRAVGEGKGFFLWYVTFIEEVKIGRGYRNSVKKKLETEIQDHDNTGPRTVA